MHFSKKHKFDCDFRHVQTANFETNGHFLKLGSGPNRASGSGPFLVQMLTCFRQKNTYIRETPRNVRNKKEDLTEKLVQNLTFKMAKIDPEPSFTACISIYIHI